MKRTVYYAARLISDQKEKEFHGDHYNGIKKIYSIWICIETQKYRADSIQEYHLTEQLIHGDFRDDPKNYDLIPTFTAALSIFLFFLLVHKFSNIFSFTIVNIFLKLILIKPPSRIKIWRR